MRKLESLFTARVTREMRMCNAMVYPIIACEQTPAGYPDRVVWHSYWQGWIEFKAQTTKLEPHQVKVIRELNKRRPGSAVVVREWEGGMIRIENEDGRLLGEVNDGKELVRWLGRYRDDSAVRIV